MRTVVDPRRGGAGFFRAVGAALLAGLALAAACSGPHRGPPLATRPPVPPAPLPAGGVVLVRVGLAAALPAAILTAEGPVRLLDGRRRLLRRAATGKVTVRAVPGGVAWRRGAGEERRSRLLLVVPDDPDTPVRWNGRSYPGELWLLAGSGGLTLVNAVPLEEYLRGVVPWEIGRRGESALAALRAQAVAARTYTLAHLGERQALGFDLWADVRDQVYRGRAGTDPWTDRAVRDTRGLVLLHDGAPIAAYYSACCGGWCSDAAAVWPRPPLSFLPAHPDTAPDGHDWCAAAPTHDWTVTWPAAALEHILARTLPAYLAWRELSPARRRWAGPAFRPAHPGADPRYPGRLLAVAVQETTSSGRVARLAVTTTSGTYWIRGDRVRWVLAPPGGDGGILRSARFHLAVRRRGGRPVSVTAHGHGYGHGVGLCQAGALGMARAGRDYRRILAHYYPGTVLAPLEGVSRGDV